jgi:hypothetical protein
VYEDVQYPLWILSLWTLTTSISTGGFSPKTAALGGALSLLGTESGIGDYGHLKSEGGESPRRRRSSSIPDLVAVL